MADRFVLTAQVQLQAPTNVRTVVNQMQRQLKGVNVPLNVKGSNKAAKQIKQTAQSLKTVQNSAKGAATGMNKLELALGGALRQVIRYDIARAVINMFTRTIRDGVKDAVAFEREMIKISQVTKRSMITLQDLTKTITKFSVGLGTSSASLVKTSRVLSQTGMSAKEVKQSLEALAKTTLAPTFDDIANTTETAIAAMRQFNIEAKSLESVLGSINAVAGQFAVEASDIGVAIRRAGGAFRSAGGELNELIALFTSVRSTTRETAETIATGFRTIFTRMQRPRTIKFLKEFGINLQDLSGKFVGPYEAVRRLHNALAGLDPRDVRYSQIVEQLGGFRQVSKVIPMIQQFAVAQSALNVAQEGGNSLSEDAAKAQEALAVKLKKVTEEFKDLFRQIVGSTAFQVMAEAAMTLASAIAQLGKALAPIIPLITALGAAKGIQLLAGKFLGKGRMGFNRGGMVPGTGNTDSVPAMLTPGEFVIRKSSVKAIGSENLQSMNKYAAGGPIRANRIRTADMQDRIVRKATGLNDPKNSGPIMRTTQFNDHDQLSVQSLIRKRVTFTNETQKDPKTKRKRSTGFWIVGVPGGKKTGRVPKKTYPRPSALTGPQFEQVLKSPTVGFMREGAGTTGGNQRFDGKAGRRTWVEARSRGERTGTSVMLGKAYGQASVTPSIKGSRLTADSDKHRLRMSVLLYENASKFNKGGGVASSDTVPALLTPGEFVFNKKSAQSIGYGNLRSMNNAGVTGYAKGGVVGVKRFATGGGSGGGRGGIGGMFDKLKGKGDKLGESMGGLMMKFFMAQMVVEMATSGIKKMAGVTEESNQKLGGMIDALGSAAIALYLLSAAANSAAIAKFFTGIGSTVGKTAIGGKIATMAGMGGGTAVAANIAKHGGTAATGGWRGAAGFNLLRGRALSQQGAAMTKMAGTSAKLPPSVANQIFRGGGEMSKKALKQLRTGPGTLTSKTMSMGSKLSKEQLKAAKSLNKLVGSNAKLVKETGAVANNAAKMGKNLSTAGAAATKAGKAMAAGAMAIGAVTIALDAYASLEKKRALKSIELATSDADAEAQRGTVEGMGALGGAAKGAGIGMLIGSFIPVIGTAIGGVIGGIVGGFTGYWNAVDEAEKAITRNKFGRAMKDFTSALQEATEGAGNPAAMASRISAGMEAVMQRMTEAMEPQDIENFKGQVKEVVPQMQAYISKITANTKSFAQLEAIISERTLRQFANLSGIGFDTLKRQIDDTHKAMKEQEEAAKAQAAAALQAAKLMITATNMAQAFNVVKTELEKFDKELNNLNDRISGTAKVAQVSSFGATMKNLDSEAKFDTSGFTGFLGTMEKTLRPAVLAGASDLTSTFKDASKAQAELPAVLIANKDAIAQAIQTGEDPGEIIVERLKDKMGVANLDQAVEDQIVAKIKSMTTTAEGGKTFTDKLNEDAKGLSEGLLKGTSAVKKAAEAMAGTIDTATKTLSKLHTKRIQLNMQITDSMNKENQLRKTRRKVELSFRGKDMTGAEEEAAFQTQQANIQGVGFPGRQLQVGGLAAKFQADKKAVAASDKQLQNLSGMSPEDMNKVIKANADLREGLARTKQALESYTNVQQRTAQLQVELNKLADARKKKLEAVQNFAFATDKDRVTQLKAFNATLVAVRGGLDKIPQEMRPAVGNMLKQFGDVQLPGFGGKTGNELAAEMSVDEIERLMGRKFTPGQRKEMIEQTAGEAGLQKKILQAHDDAITAQRALTEGLKQDRQDLNKMLVRVQTKFLLDLKKIMFEAQRSEEEAKKQEADAQLKVLGEQRAAMNAVVVSAGGVGDPQGLRVNEIMEGKHGGPERLRAKLGTMIAGKEAEQGIGKIRGLTESLRRSAGYGVSQGGGGASLDFLDKLFAGSGGRFGDTASFMADAFKGRDWHEGWLTTDFRGNFKAEEATTLFSGLQEAMSGFLQNQGGLSRSESEVVSTEVLSRLRDLDREDKIKDVQDMGVHALKILREVVAKGHGEFAGLGQKETQILAGERDTKAMGLQGLTLEEMKRMQTELAGVQEGQNLIKVNTELARQTKISGELKGVVDALDKAIQETARQANALNAGLKTGPVKPGKSTDPAKDFGLGQGITDAAAAVKSKGGLIYANNGIFVPKGTDTVPAMLTPGEFVVRRAAVKAVGVDTLRAINSMGGAKHFSRGGQAGYYHNGDLASGGLGMMGLLSLDQAVNRFSSEVSRLSGILETGMTVSVGGTIDVNVNINGGEIIAAAGEHLGDLAAMKVHEGINDMLKAHFPRIRRMNRIQDFINSEEGQIALHGHSSSAAINKTG